jgi:hypothetical protein
MENFPASIRCDGCGLPGSAKHVRERVQRLERATRFRPIHTNVLFVASDPSRLIEDDFYLAPLKQPFFKGIMEALNIASTGEPLPADSGDPSSGNTELLEFQRRGYYLTYLSECPLDVDRSIPSEPKTQAARDAISRLAPTLITRIRFNYKPKHVVLLGSNLYPLIGLLEQTDLASLLVLDQGNPLPVPPSDDGVSSRQFREAFAREIPGLKSASAV